MLQKIKDDLRALANSEKAKLLAGFFKTGKGQYGEGDIFLGIMVPESRKIVKRYFKESSLTEIKSLIESKIHEERFVGAMMLVEKFKIGDDNEKKVIYEFYLANARNINNWDLVDLSAPNIVGGFLSSPGSSPGLKLDQLNSRDILYKLAKSDNLWERRISVLATFTFIRQNDFTDILLLSEMLLNDKHDLMHKAVGWMLREVGKRDVDVLGNFLDKNIKKMPRTMLRYSIEKFDSDTRKQNLSL